MLLKRFLTVWILLIFLNLSFPMLAYAYLDPGTGSYIFQLIIAGIAGFLFLLKIYWKRIKSFFVKLTSKDSRNDAVEEE